MLINFLLREVWAPLEVLPKHSKNLKRCPAASGIKRCQDYKQFDSWFNVLIQIMKSRASYQPDQGIEQGSYTTNLSDQTPLLDDIPSEATPSPTNNSSDVTDSIDSPTPKAVKMYVPIKSKRE